MTAQTGKTPPTSGEYDPHGDIKKIIGILAALAIFIIILYAYIIPLQGGFVSSTSIRSEDLLGADPRFEEQLPIRRSTSEPPGGRSLSHL